jgi:hypothetical protein
MHAMISFATTGFVESSTAKFGLIGCFAAWVACRLTTLAS